ncbi:hypothetical protein ACTHGU_11000 [Chitinophagaceae bacterium MMS25-I14]
MPVGTERKNAGIGITLKSFALSVDWVLLMLLLTVTQNRFFALKIVAILAITAFRPAFRFLKGRNMSHFYLSLAILVIFQYLFVVRDFSAGYLTVALYAAGQWILLTLMALQFCYQACYRNDDRAHRAINIFFWVNVVCTLIKLVRIMFITKTINPYEYASEPMYGVSTGDHLAGYFGYHIYWMELGDYSSVNSAVLPMFFLYFMFRRKWLNASVGLFVLLVTTSNLINIFLLGLLAIICIAEYRKKLSAPAVVFFAGIIAFYTFVTPKNFRYAEDQILKKIFHVQLAHKDNHAGNGAPRASAAPSPGINISQVKGPMGKMASFKETGQIMVSSPSRFLFGTGAGRFSSQLAFIAASDSAAKGHVFRPLQYRSDVFEKNHWQMAETIKSLPVEYHSVMNSPTSFYSQLAGEYGLVGIILFIVLYLLFFMRMAWAGYGKYLIALVCFLAAFEYIFDTFCIVIMFELLMALNMKRETAFPFAPAENDKSPL